MWQPEQTLINDGNYMTEKTTQQPLGLASDLNAELGLLKDIINRVADELGLPTENGNRVHDVLFWLDSPKPIDCTDEQLIKQMNVAQRLAQSENGLDKFRFARGFANRVLMHWGNKEGMQKALLTPFTVKT